MFGKRENNTFISTGQSRAFQLAQITPTNNNRVFFMGWYGLVDKCSTVLGDLVGLSTFVNSYRPDKLKMEEPYTE